MIAKNALFYRVFKYKNMYSNLLVICKSTSAMLKNEMSAQTEGEIQNLLNVNDFGARSDWQTSVRRRRSKYKTNVKCASVVEISLFISECE